jgi:hypothetical protein
MNEKELKEKIYNFGFEAAKWPSDENIKELKKLIGQLLTISDNSNVNSKARTAIALLDKTIKFKTIDRRKKDFVHILDYTSRIAFYQ